MAVTITQQPTTPNAAYTRLPYVVSGSVTTSNPQYQYVMDVYESGSTDRIARLTQTPNPQGVAVFDPSRIFQGELGIDEVWTTPAGYYAFESNKEFNIKFGEQYGTSISSSITVYPDLTSHSIDLIPAVVDPNNGISYNFPSQSYDIFDTADTDVILSNDPLKLSQERQVYPQLPGYDIAKPIGQDDYETNTYYTNFPFDIVSMVVEVFSGSVDLTPVLDFTIAPKSTIDIVYIGAGPQNLISLSTALETAFQQDWTHYVVGARYSETPPGATARTVIYVNENLTEEEVSKLSYQGSGFLLTQMPPTCSKEKTRFAFINRYGVWDYYNNFNPVRRSSNIQRESVSLPQLDYSSISSPYNINNRGQKDYYTEVKDRFVVDTPLLDKNMANWLEELLNSPSVYIQKGSCFIPVVITNSQYQHNNDTSRNKLFQYTIEFEPANQPYGDWDQIGSTCGTVDYSFSFTVSPSSTDQDWRTRFVVGRPDDIEPEPVPNQFSTYDQILRPGETATWTGKLPASTNNQGNQIFIASFIDSQVYWEGTIDGSLSSSINGGPYNSRTVTDWAVTSSGGGGGYFGNCPFVPPVYEFKNGDSITGSAEYTLINNV